MKQNPFSLYDFLGYLIPGSTLIYLFIIITSWEGNSITTLDSVFTYVSDNNFQDAFFFIIVSYALGHLISFISSITIEKYGNWKYGYPSKTVIGYTKKSYWIQKNTQHNAQVPKQIVDTEVNFCKRKFRNSGRAILLILLSPLTIIEYAIGSGFNFSDFYSKGLDDYLMNSIKHNVLSLLNSKGISSTKEIKEDDLINIDFNRIVHHYAFENSKEHQFRMVNYVALYGFLRNLVLTFVLSFWYYFFTISLQTINFKNTVDWNSIMILITLMLLSFTAFMAYMKFYRRYTLEGLMLIVVDKNI